MSSFLGEGTKYRNQMISELSHFEHMDPAAINGFMKHAAAYGDKLKWVGRSMSAMDAVNMTMADEAAQRMFARYAFSEMKGLNPDKIPAMLDDLFNPDVKTVSEERLKAMDEVREHMGDKSPKDQERWIKRRTNELLVNRREEVLPGISEYGKTHAEHATYNNDPEGFLGKMTGIISSQVNTKYKAGKFVFSFMQTLSNIVNQTLDYTPYGFVRGANKTISQSVTKPGEKNAPRRFVNDSPEQYAQHAKAAIGTTFMVGLAFMAYRGYEDEQDGKVPFFTITGAGPEDRLKRQQLIDSGGWKENSVKIGNAWVRYMDFPIIGSTLGAIGTMLDALRYKKDDATVAETMGRATMAAATTILDKQLLQGANNFFQIFRGGQQGQQTSALKRFVGGVVGGFTNPGMVRWIKNTVDMDQKGMVNRLDQSTTGGWLASMIPFSIGYDTPALNALGDPIQQPWYSATTYRFVEPNRAGHPIFTPIINAGLTLPNPSKSSNFHYTDGEGMYVQTTFGKHPELFREFVKARGDIMKQLLTPETIAQIVGASKENLSDAQAFLNNRIGEYANKHARAKIESDIRAGKLKL